MAEHAILGHRRMLISEWTTILRVATEAELIGICRTQIVSTRASMWIVAVGTTHLSFAQRVMVRQAHLPAFSLVTLQTGVICLPARLHDGLGFGHQVLHIFRLALSRDISNEVKARVCLALCVVRMGLMAVNTADSIGGVRSRCPVANSLIPGVTTQTHAIRFRRRSFLERDNFRNISAPFDVQASQTVALLALDALLRMKGMAIIFRDVGMAGRASIRSRRSSTRNLCVLCERCGRMLGIFGCNQWPADNNHRGKDEQKEEDSGSRPHRLPPLLVPLPKPISLGPEDHGTCLSGMDLGRVTRNPMLTEGPAP